MERRRNNAIEEKGYAVSQPDNVDVSDLGVRPSLES